jgi:2,3-bisphosphoglycerate-independent phosphoglycerate mutase
VVAVLVIPDGAAQPLRPGAPTALEAARTPVLDALAATGEVRRVAVTPAGVTAGSEAGVPTLLGHPPTRPLGRGRIDAAGYGVRVPAGAVAWRADVPREAGAGAACAAAAALGGAWTHGHRLVLFAPEGRAPAGGPGVRVWPDGGTLPRALDASTVVVAAPGAAAGCARLLGASLVIPAGATGDVDTDLHAKAQAAAAAIARGARNVVVHVGAPDEAAHRRDFAAKVAALEAIDAELLAPLRDAVAMCGATLAVCPDHGTDPCDGTHDGGAVPALRWGRGIAPAGPDRMTEAATAGAPVRAPTWALRGALAAEVAA